MIMEWTDPNDGLVYEVDYIVTQSEAEGPEHVEWRVKGSTEWDELPPFAYSGFLAKCETAWFGSPVTDQ